MIPTFQYITKIIRLLAILIKYIQHKSQAFLSIIKTSQVIQFSQIFKIPTFGWPLIV